MHKIKVVCTLKPTFKGRVYIIKNNIDDQVCIGSTKRTLGTRWGEYRCSYNNVKSSHYNMVISGLMREHGFDQFHIELLEELDITSNRELFAREGFWQTKYRNDGFRLTNTQTARGLGKDITAHRRANPESYQKMLVRNGEQIQCPNGCGASISRGSKSRHLKKYCPLRDHHP